MRKIFKTVNTFSDFDVKLFEELNIGVEIQDWTNPNLSDQDTENLISLYKKYFQDFSGDRAMHGPFLDLKPASPDLMIRQVSYNKYLKTMKVAKELEVDFLIFHSQINPYLNEPSLKALNNHQAAEFWQKILKESDYEGLILIENVFEEEPLALKEYIEKIGKERVRINLDIGHAKVSSAPLHEWIGTLKDYIAYIHVHSNDGIYDRHLIPSQEEIDQLYNTLDKHGVNCPLSLEYKVGNLREELGKYINE